VKRWLAAQVGRLVIAGTGVVVILDPEGALTDADVADLARTIEVIRVTNWIALRRVWDLDIRRRESYQHVALLVVSGDLESANDLPWDVEHEATAVVRLRWPVPTEIRLLFQGAGEHADALTEAARTHASTGEILAAVFGTRYGTPAQELDTVAMLRLDPSTPGELWDVLSQVFVTPLARQIAVARGRLDALQAAWEDWLQVGDESPSAAALEAAAGAVLALLGNGLLTPAPVAATDLPKWVSIGAADPDPDELVNQLLATRPSQPTNVREWIETASWWGQVRAVIATEPVPPQSAETAWETWQQIDAEFGAWLRRSYGTSLLSAAPTPRALHQVAPFLARRVDDGARVLLVVVDGLGFAQWYQVRAATGLKVVQATGCLAMIPTLTGVSRQAIFAGALPGEFADTLTTTSAEPRRWAAFWAGRGLAAREVTYSKTLGSDAGDVPKLAGRVAAVVVYAVDEMLHGAEVLGDRQVAAGVDVWIRAGFPRALVEAGIEGGYEVWVTSDHGNLPTVAGPVPSEGQTVESLGTRVRMYPNDTLRDAAIEFGDIWDPPGYPDGQLRPLFAPGRRGYHTSGVKVSHGGLSLDEVIVPFVQVTT
jgi:hypothetical protein